MPTPPCSWISCQIGAREHYTIPRALQQQGQLSQLITDAWVSPQSVINFLPKNLLANLRERYHPDLEKADVLSFNSSLIQFELSQRLHKKTGWERVFARNQWFQQQAIKSLTSLANQFIKPPILFAYSYAALELFRFAKQQGWYTVLGQIDPGIQEEMIVTQEYERYPQYSGNWQPASIEYWQNWQEECNIADAIVVNSDWSRQLLEKTGVDFKKIHIIPLVYTPPAAANQFVRIYPKSFSQERPLRVLFLGQVILRKGIAAVLDAVQLLEGYPVEFWIVGSQQLDIPQNFQTHSQIRWVDHVNRSETAQYYQMADVFLFPTLSDGFGLTQLEAKAWKLPIIASRCCGDVVVDGENGWILEEVSGEKIANVINCILLNTIKLPVQYNTLNSNPKFDLSNLFTSLQKCLI
ncbi:glycosyltransferase [Anabaena cylindrica FACHB-243]|uniref:Glycosyl transferase group 1 n=1 Tax=Anabaena cylindrica (strain ATCC 27899 / PCC 7122) TaxID=272123 RepID=K9ZIX0_ANACC|nr:MULTISPECIES: glycosyltransferase [Anabaena]AFZ59156.1 glycosyl transferase group 1 [Anabaena cylindrica PCC 7122]MBD2416506.1 glycosyltransferase [Anabaena cylindrica FACHB-243]MBY5281078.1 glycosyltransferase family 4 protein [Anabaena sp. CCAP 1446/1C]MBY5309865.1 glycosyltransferase family 4 protein [Anabaena sp. CCAP 1446/1C]MCM2407444.1 glycosyltransferase [Anabaena sp. CCAP 1446/1C]